MFYKAKRLKIEFRSVTWISGMVAAVLLCLPDYCRFALARQITLEKGSWKLQLATGHEKLKIQDLASGEIFYRQAVKDALKDKTASRDDVAKCEQSLADILQVEGKTEEVLPLYIKAMSSLENQHGKNCRQIVPILQRLGAVWELDGDYRRADKYDRKALLIIAKTDGKEGLAYADCEHQLGHLQVKFAQVQSGVALYDNALSLIMHQRILKSSDLLENVVDDYIDALSQPNYHQTIADNQYQRELLKDRIESVESTQGTSTALWDTEVSGHPLPNGKIHGPEALSFPPITPSRPIADAFALEQMQKQRETFYKRMIATDVDALGPNHPSVARDLYGLALVYLSDRKFSEAKPLLLKALTIYQNTYREEAEPVRALKSLLSVVVEEKKTEPITSSTGTEYVSTLTYVPQAAQKLEIALGLDYLALLCYSKGKLAQADKMFAWALAATAYTCGEHSMLTASCLTDYSQLLKKLGKRSEAILLENCAQSLTIENLRAQAELTLPK